MALNRSAAVVIHGSLHAPGVVNFLKQRTVFHFAGRRLRPRSVDVLATNGCLFRPLEEAQDDSIFQSLVRDDSRQTELARQRLAFRSGRSK